MKYIPEIQQEVERLIKKKEELLSKISRQGDIIHQENQRNCIVNESPLSAVSATRFSDKEIGVQISTFKVHGSLISEVLLYLEDELLVINASSFESSGGRVFYNLHLQVLLIPSNWFPESSKGRKKKTQKKMFFYFLFFIFLCLIYLEINLQIPKLLDLYVYC